MQAILDNPKGHTYDEAASVLTGLDFTPPKGSSGSHRFWKHPSGCRVGLVDKGSGTMPVEYIKTMVQSLRTYGLIPDAQKGGQS